MSTTSYTLSNGAVASITKIESRTTVALALCEVVDMYAEHWQVEITCGGLRRMWYVGTGYKGAVTKKSERSQFVVWYGSGKMWHSFGTSINAALEGAMRDAWVCA